MRRAIRYVKTRSAVVVAAIGAVTFAVIGASSALQWRFSGA
jgi:hypothetical protein